MALRLVPTEASTAVMQVPMFCPNSTYTALSSPMTPLMASACKMPTEAEEDWMIAVNSAPAAMPRSGFEKELSRFTKAGHSARGSMEAPIMSMPMNRTPSPARMLP